MKNRILPLLLTLSICLCTDCCFSQITKTISGDTSFWFDQHKNDSLKFGLSNLIYSKDRFHFRFSTEGHIIDIWSVDGKVYQGSLLIYKFGYKEQKEDRPNPEPNPLYDLKVSIDTSLSRKAFNLIKAIDAIPSQHAIKGWQDGFDGIEYVFQTSTPSIFNFRSYWTPTAQDSSVTAAKIIEKFRIDLDSLAAYNTNYRTFFHTLKPGEYIDGDGMVMTKLTPKQTAYYRRTKPYRDYLDSVRDTLNNFLNSSLTRILQAQQQDYCEVFLKFSKENKLLKVKTADRFTSAEDRRVFRSTKKRIIAAFKSIEINFIHSSRPYWKGLHVDSNDIFVYNAPDYFAKPVLAKR